MISKLTPSMRSESEGKQATSQTTQLYRAPTSKTFLHKRHLALTMLFSELAENLLRKAYSRNLKQMFGNLWRTECYRIGRLHNDLGNDGKSGSISWKFWYESFPCWFIIHFLLQFEIMGLTAIMFGFSDSTITSRKLDVTEEVEFCRSSSEETGGSKHESAEESREVD